MHLIHSNGSSRLSIIKKYQLLLGTSLFLICECACIYVCGCLRVCGGGGGGKGVVAVPNQAG